MILYNILFLVIIIVLLISSFILSSIIRKIYTKDNSNECLSILFLTDYNKNTFNSSKQWGQAIYYNYILSKFLLKNYPDINFNIYLKAFHKKTDINRLIRFVHDNNIKIIIPTESKNSYLLSKYRNNFYNVSSYFMNNYQYYEILDDKYKLRYFCEKYSILYPNTVSVYDRSICEVLRFIRKYKNKVYLKKRINTLGGEDVYDLSNVDIEKENIQKKINNIEWIVQKKIEGIFVGVDVLYIKGKIKGITFHKNINYKKMYKGYCNYYFPSNENMYSHNGLRMNEYFYVEYFMIILVKIGKITQYNGLMNVDFIYKLDMNSIRIYLLEINPRMGGSIHISTYSGLLESYFDYLIYKRINKNIIKYKNIDIEKWSNHRYTMLIPYIFDNINVILNVDNLKDNSKLTLF